MKTVLSHANLIDCVEPKVRPDSAVLIEDGRIRAILPSGEADSASGDAQVIDLKDGYLMPGLWDVHIHPDHLSLDEMPVCRSGGGPSSGCGSPASTSLPVYAVLVERRGYGRSDGPAWSEAVGRDVGSVLIARLQAEADDVLAAVEYLRSVPSADISRLGIAGWSLGGIVTLFAISRSRSFRAAVDQAGGVLMWRFSPALQTALTRRPTLLGARSY